MLHIFRRRHTADDTSPRSTFTGQVLRVPVTERIVAGRHPYDYADAFEVREPSTQPHPPETWVRAGLATTSGPVDRIVGLLGLSDGADSTDQLGPFRVVTSDAEVVHLEADISLMSIVMVGRRVEPAKRMLTTALHFKRPLLARIAWAVIGPVHRRTARNIIAAAIDTTPSSSRRSRIAFGPTPWMFSSS